MKTRFTPGPWVAVLEQDKNTTIRRADGNSEYPIAHIEKRKPSAEQSNANIKLITQAPVMFEMLKSLIGQCNSNLIDRHIESILRDAGGVE